MRFTINCAVLTYQNNEDEMKITKQDTIKDGSTPQITNETVAEHREDVTSKDELQVPASISKAFDFQCLILTFVAVSVVGLYMVSAYTLKIPVASCIELRKLSLCP